MMPQFNYAEVGATRGELPSGYRHLRRSRLIGPLRAPCRVVYLVEEPGRRGFAYGTTAGHPEIGEESFVVEHDSRTDEVHARIVAFSRPGHWLIRLGGPANRMAQAAITRRYLRALEV